MRFNWKGCPRQKKIQQNQNLRCFLHTRTPAPNNMKGQKGDGPTWGGHALNATSACFEVLLRWKRRNHVSLGPLARELEAGVPAGSARRSFSKPWKTKQVLNLWTCFSKTLPSFLVVQQETPLSFQSSAGGSIEITLLYTLQYRCKRPTSKSKKQNDVPHCNVSITFSVP